MNQENITQINPGNRVDFSRVRKMYSGGATEYDPVTYLPKYQRSLYTDGLKHIGDYALTAIGLEKQKNYAMQKQTASPMAPHQSYIKTDGYIQRKTNEEAKNQMLARADAQASNSSSMEAQQQIRQQANEQAMELDVQNNQIQADEYGFAEKEGLQVTNSNNQLSTEYRNLRDQYDKALFNERLADLSKFELQKTAAQKEMFDNLDLSRQTYEQHEKFNELEHDMAIDTFRYNQAKRAAYNDIQDFTRFGFKHLNYNNGQNYDGLINHIISGELGNKMSEADMNTLAQNRDNISVTLPILKKYAGEFPDIQAFVTAYESAYGGLDAAYMDKMGEIEDKYALAGLYRRKYYSSGPGRRREGLGRNWDNLFPGRMMKSGGKVYDRMLEYVKHNKKVLDERNARSEKAKDRANKKLLRDLDALDRETLLLLRSIFN